MTTPGILIICVIGLIPIALLALGIYLVRRDKSPQTVTVKQRGLLSRPADWIALIFLVIVAYWVISSLTGGSILSSSHKITMRVSGNAGSVSITQSNAQGGTEQYDSGLPYQVVYDMPYSGYAYISAQKQSEGGTITCEILDNDQPWKKSTANAAYGIATCSGLVGQ